MKSTNPIAALFGRSPFKPMQEHMGIVNECVAQVPVLFDALIAGDKAGVEKAKDAIYEKEHAADQLMAQLRIHLPKSMFMPVDRRDLLGVFDMQDAIANTAQDIADLLMQRDMEVPESMKDDLRTLVQRCVDACVQCGAIIGELDELIETGFRGPEAARVEGMVEELNRIESETDTLAISLTRNLFEQEDSISPVSLVFWYQLIRWIGDLADYSEKAGDRLLLLIAR